MMNWKERLIQEDYDEINKWRSRYTTDPYYKPYENEIIKIIDYLNDDIAMIRRIPLDQWTQEVDDETLSVG
jgi:hypothetical protein